MNLDFTKSVLAVAQAIQKDANELWLPPAESMPSRSEMVLPNSLVKGTRGYIEKVAYQINTTYESACYDACAVMIRRLVETLIIETFEQNNIAAKIKAPGGDFFYLRDLITCALDEPRWNLGRNAKQALSKLKDIGDQSAHSRRFNAQRHYIDEIIPYLRVVVQELVYLAKLK